MDDYKWTTGNDGSLKHNRVIDFGASGGVHELHNSKSGEVYVQNLIVNDY